MTARHLAFAAAALGAARPATAQEPRPPVASGARVRLVAPALGPGRTAWNVAGVRGDTLLLLPAGAGGGPRVAVALADVTRLEVNRGPRRNALAGGVAGLMLGAAAGAIYGASNPGPFSGLSCIVLCTEEQFRQSQRPAPKDWAVLGGMAGAPLGVLVGRFVVGDHWQPVVPGRARVSLAPGEAGGVRVALTVPAR